MGNPVSNCARLAATRSGKDKHRPFGGFDGFTLLRI
jgi:hypothetical protein